MPPANRVRSGGVRAILKFGFCLEDTSEIVPRMDGPIVESGGYGFTIRDSLTAHSSSEFDQVCQRMIRALSVPADQRPLLIDNKSGSLAMLMAIRRASSIVRTCAVSARDYLV